VTTSTPGAGFGGFPFPFASAFLVESGFWLSWLPSCVRSTIHVLGRGACAFVGPCFLHDLGQCELWEP
jgi:hypothetical protein